MVGARQIFRDVVRVRVSLASVVVSVDIVEDKQPLAIVLTGKPARYLSDNYIDIGVAASRVRPA